MTDGMVMIAAMRVPLSAISRIESFDCLSSDNIGNFKNGNKNQRSGSTFDVGQAPRYSQVQVFHIYDYKIDK